MDLLNLSKSDISHPTPFSTVSDLLNICAVALPAAEAASVELWLVNVDFNRSLRDTVFSALSEEEKSGARRFLHKADRLRHATARAALREVLGRVLDCSPSQLCFEREATGRPMLVGDALGSSKSTNRIDFNLSHSGKFALIAVSQRRRVGVDIERFDSELDWQSLSGLVLAPTEECFMQNLPNERRTAEFFRTWTAKEALLKGIGCGLLLNPATFSVLSWKECGIVDVCKNNKPYELSAVNHKVTCFEGHWCVVPSGYTACVAWSSSEINGCD